MTVAYEIVVPALAARTTAGDLDLTATAEYAERAAATWIDRFIISGSTTRGDSLSTTDRACLLDLWLDVASPDRLVACCWCPEDIREATDRGVRPMAVIVIHGPTTATEALTFLQQLPPAAFVYSHPMYGGAVLDASLARTAKDTGRLPAGAKLAKVSLDELSAIRSVCGADVTLWDGTCRHIARSVMAGADGVVATPLSSLPSSFPSRSLGALQRAVDPLQQELDNLTLRHDRTARLLYLAFPGSSKPPISASLS